MDDRRKFSRSDKDREDVPIYSRLVIVCDRDLKEEQFREAFSEFGTIEDIRIPCDHNTGKPRGVVFIKFSKTSEAARALEAMNSKVLKNTSCPLKVMVAASRSEIQSDDYSNDKYRRLFLHIPTSMDEDMLKERFKTFGFIEDVLISIWDAQRDRNTKESKGFAYIKYRKFSEAALAYEECERSFRAIFAQPKGHNRHPETAFETNQNTLATSLVNQNTSLISMMNVNPRGFTRVNFTCSPYITQINVKTLFDIIPGLVDYQYFFDLNKNFGKGSAQYSNPVSAAYAVQKLNEFEYPIGCRIFVKPANTQFDAHEKKFTDIPNAVTNLRNAIESSSKSSAPDLAQLAEAIAEAAKLIKKATTGVSDDNVPDSSDWNYCSAKLPPPQPRADIDSPVAKTCYLIFIPQRPPETAIADIFCRFGNLIVIQVMNLFGKHVGQAHYATVESADEAIKTLHGAEICGVHMIVTDYHI